MSRTMFDAVNASNIPRSAKMVAGYVDQIVSAPWTAADWALFPSAIKVRIVKKASSIFGNVLDVESGDALPSEAPGWVSAMRAAGYNPTVYCNYSTWTDVVNEFDKQNIAEPYYWLAKYDAIDRIPPLWVNSGVVAKQYSNTPGYDLSVVADFWPGVDPAPRNEDTGMYASAAADDFISVPADGNTKLFIATHFGRVVNCKEIWAVGDTPGATGSNVNYIGALTVTADRPGPIELLPGTRCVNIRYNADHGFTAWTAA